MDEVIEALKNLCNVVREKSDDVNRDTMYLRGDGVFVDGKGQWISPYRVLESKHVCTVVLRDTLIELYRILQEAQKKLTVDSDTNKKS